jgi:hypothetical protein
MPLPRDRIALADLIGEPQIGPTDAGAGREPILGLEGMDRTVGLLARAGALIPTPAPAKAHHVIFAADRAEYPKPGPVTAAGAADAIATLSQESSVLRALARAAGATLTVVDLCVRGDAPPVRTLRGLSTPGSQFCGRPRRSSG